MPNVQDYVVYCQRSVFADKLDQSASQRIFEQSLLVQTHEIVSNEAPLRLVQSLLLGFGIRARLII